MKNLLLSLILVVNSVFAAPFAYVTQGEAADTVVVVDLATNKIIATIPTGTIPVSVVITPTGAKAYVTNNSSNNVTVIDTATNTVIATVPVGPNPIGLAVTHDGRTVYVANSDGTLTPIDVATDTAGAVIGGFVGGAIDITISPDDKTAYVTNGAADTVTPTDLIAGTLGTPIPVGDSPERLQITPNGKKIYVLNIGAPDSISVISAATNTVTATILLPAQPVDIEITFDNRLAYVSLSDGQIVIINVGTDTIINSVTTTSPAGLALSPSGQTLYIANGSAGTLTPLNVANNLLGTAFLAGPGPFMLAITPIIAVQGQIIQNTFLNKIELVLKLDWNVLPITLASFFRIFQNGIAIGQVFAGSPATFLVCLVPNFVCPASSDQLTTVELGLFAASGVEIVRLPITIRNA